MKETDGIDDRSQILEVIENYTAALDRGDPELWESLFWLDDPEFTVIENDKPHLMGREYIEFISGLLRERGAKASGQKWYETVVHMVSPDTAYTTSLRDETFPDGAVRTSRGTLVFRMKEGEWRILHGHFSFVPE